MSGTFLKLSEIINVPGSGNAPLIPVGRSTWFAGVKDGRYPKPVQLSKRLVVWRRSDIQALIDSLEAKV